MLNTPSSPEGTPSGLSSEDIPPPIKDNVQNRSRLSMRRKSNGAGTRLISRSRNMSIPQRSNIPTSGSGKEHELRSAHNRVKLELLDALRDKKAYCSALISVKEQKDTLEKEVKTLRQQNAALETAMNSRRVSKSGKKPVWSMDSLRDTNIASYQGICLAAGELAKREAILVTTETYIDEKRNGLRKRNWTGSSAPAVLEGGSETIPYVKLPDGSTAVPSCCMYRANSGEHYVSPYVSEKGFAKYCIRKTLSSPVGTMMNNDEKAECESSILSHRPTIRKFKSILSDNVGNRKKATLGLFLRSLGYDNGAKANSEKLTPEQKSTRNLEREIVHEKCIKVDENGTIDTMHWRLSRWSKLCLDSAQDASNAHEMEEAERNMDKDGKVDNLFLNEAARRSFIEMRGHQVSEDEEIVHADVSIISLARADAGMTTMLKWLNVEGRGGIRNSNYNEFFRQLLPKAMEAIIKEVWDDLEHVVPDEMVPFMEEGDTVGREDQYGNKSREWTFVMTSDEDKCLYLLPTPMYFKQKVCSWIGNVKDCHIGRCLPNESKFVRITSSMKFIGIEESDVDEEETQIIPPLNEN